MGGLRGDGRIVTELHALGFDGLLRRLRAEARLTPEELAEAAGLSSRTVSDLERGVNRRAHKDTAGLLADALNLTDSHLRTYFQFPNATFTDYNPGREILIGIRGKF